MKLLMSTLLLILLTVQGRAQPVAVQSRIIASERYSTVVGTLDFRSDSSAFFTNGKSATALNSRPAGELIRTRNFGLSFENITEPGGNYFTIPKSGPIFRIRNVGGLQLSWDDGDTWKNGEELGGVPIDYEAEPTYSPSGLTRSVSINYDGALHVFISNNAGVHWSEELRDTTVKVTGELVSRMRWADDDHGMLITANLDSGYIALTSNAGVSWVKAVTKDNEQWDNIFLGTPFLEYPSPNCIVSHSTGSVSTDGGDHWNFPDVLPRMLQFPTGKRWVSIEPYSNANGTPRISTDFGATWAFSDYRGKHRISLISFRDSLNGIGSDGIGIVAKTTNGGFHWLTLDSSDYAAGTIAPDGAGGYYCYKFGTIPGSFHPPGSYDTGLTIFHSSNRGEFWRQIDTVTGAYAFAAQGDRMFIGGRGYVRRQSRGAHLSDLTVLSNADSTFVKVVSASEVWIGNVNELRRSTNGGTSWSGDYARFIPGYTKETRYRFLVIGNGTAYAESGDTVYYSIGGQNWFPAAAMPTQAVDVDHWVAGQTDTSLQYTRNAGSTFENVRMPSSGTSLFMVDTVRWYAGRYYTSTAGATWDTIPGWISSDSLEVLDRGVAFGQPYKSYDLTDERQLYVMWRLDLPFAERGAVRSARNASEFFAYPNPADRIVKVRLDDEQSAERGELIDAVGTLRRIYSTSELRQGIDVSMLTPGVYYLHIVGTVQNIPIVVRRN